MSPTMHVASGYMVIIPNLLFNSADARLVSWPTNMLLLWEQVPTQIHTWFKFKSVNFNRWILFVIENHQEWVEPCFKSTKSILNKLNSRGVGSKSSTPLAPFPSKSWNLNENQITNLWVSIVSCDCTEHKYFPVSSVLNICQHQLCLLVVTTDQYW